MNRCPYCGCELRDLDTHSDHIVPKSRGGIAGRRNRVSTCSRCNIRKRAKDVWEWHAALMARGQLRKAPRLEAFLAGMECKRIARFDRALPSREVLVEAIRSELRSPTAAYGSTTPIVPLQWHQRRRFAVAVVDGVCVVTVPGVNAALHLTPAEACALAAELMDEAQYALGMEAAS